MKRPALRFAFSIFSLLTFFINPLFVGSVEADYLKVDVPSEVFQNEQFSSAIEISAKPNSIYFLKARIGQNQSEMTKGQTLDEASGVWLSDSVNWERFPKFQTDGDGRWVGSLKVRTSQSSSLGQNLFVIRIKSTADGSTKDSEPYQISLLEAPAPAPEAIVEEKGDPILNEFLPSPISGSEWVEIKNKGTGKIDLGGWLIDDEEGKSSPFEIPANTIVEPNGFYVAYFSSAKLNDLEDSVRLLKPDGTVVEEYRYQSPEKGKSFTKDSGGNWFKTAEITPGTTNPNPPNVSTAGNENEKSQILAEKTESEEESLNTSLPKLTTSTESAKIATVSGSFKDLEKGTKLINKIPFVLGIFLIFSALAILVKNTYTNYKNRKSKDLAAFSSDQ